MRVSSDAFTGGWRAQSRGTELLVSSHVAVFKQQGRNVDDYVTHSVESALRGEDRSLLLLGRELRLHLEELRQRKVCVVFEFGKLGAMVNCALNPEAATLLYEGNPCRQIFSVNYGLVNEVDWDTHRTNKQYLSNLILYTYLKDAVRFCEEKELRISLSAIGIGYFSLRDGTPSHFLCMYRSTEGGNALLYVNLPSRHIPISNTVFTLVIPARRPGRLKKTCALGRVARNPGKPLRRPC